MASTFSIYDAVALLPEWAQDRRRDPFHFGAEFSSIAGNQLPANGTRAVDVKISDDADFVLVMQQVQATDANFAAVAGQLTVTLRDQGAGKDVSNNPLFHSTWFGIGQSPFVQPQPKILYRSSVMTVTVTNLDAANPRNAFFVFSGFKMYGPPIAPGTI